MLEHCISHSQITFSILKIDWIYLMRHCGRPYLSFHISLLEISKRDIPPHVPRKIYQNCIGKGNNERYLCYGIMGLNLSCVRVPLNSQTFHKLLRQSNPIFIWVSNFMSIQVTHSPIKFSFWNNSF